MIRNSFTSGPVGGYEIWQDAPTPEDVENLWNDKNYNGKFVPYVREFYRFNLEYIWNDDGRVVDTKYFLEKCEAEIILWRTEIPFSGGKYCKVADGVIVYGCDITCDSDQVETDYWIGKIHHNGTLLWIHMLENSFDKKILGSVLENADGSYTLFSVGDNQILCVSRYSPDGERTLYKETDLGTYTIIGHVANYGDGYLLQIYTGEKNEVSRFVQVDQQGNVQNGFSYKDPKNNYVILDMIEWGGKVYISAYATPKLGEDEPTYGRSEIARILDVAFNLYDMIIPDEELTPMVRDNYAAVLLICDPDKGGKLQVFYTIPGSLGAELMISDDGRLIWETESITTTFFSPVTSSYTIGGICNVYQYAFDEDGALVGRGKTDKVTNFHR